MRIIGFSTISDFIFIIYEYFLLLSIIPRTLFGVKLKGMLKKFHFTLESRD